MFAYCNNLLGILVIKLQRQVRRPCPGHYQVAYEKPTVMTHERTNVQGYALHQCLLLQNIGGELKCPSTEEQFLKYKT